MWVYREEGVASQMVEERMLESSIALLPPWQARTGPSPVATARAAAAAAARPFAARDDRPAPARDHPPSSPTPPLLAHPPLYFSRLLPRQGKQRPSRKSAIARRAWMPPSSALASSSTSSPRVKPRGPVPAGSPSRSRSPSQRAQQAPSAGRQSQGSPQQQDQLQTAMLPTTLDPSVLRPTAGAATTGRPGPGAAGSMLSSSTTTTTDASASDPIAGSSALPAGGSASSQQQQPLTSRLHNLLKRAPAPVLEEEAADANAPSAGTFSLSSTGGSSSGSTSILSSFFSALANGGSSSSSSSASAASTAADGATASSGSHTTGLGLSILADPELDFDLGAESRRIVSSALADVDLSTSSTALLPSATLSNELPVGSIEPPGSGGGSGAATPSLFDPGTMTTTLPATIEPSHLKKVKVYELRAEAWFDRGTGHVHGLYDEQADRALLVVTGEEVYNPAVDDAPGPPQADGTEGGGFVREEKEWGTVDVGEGGRKGRCLMMSFIQARDIYQKQQGACLPSRSSCYTHTSRISLTLPLLTNRHSRRLDRAGRGRYRPQLCRRRRLRQRLGIHPRRPEDARLQYVGVLRSGRAFLR